MSRTYADLGLLYGTHSNARTYGTLFDPDIDEAPTVGLVALLARVSDLTVAAVVSDYEVIARVTSSQIDARLN